MAAFINYLGAARKILPTAILTVLVGMVGQAALQAQHSPFAGTLTRLPEHPRFTVAAAGKHKEGRIFVRRTLHWSANHALQARILYSRPKPKPGSYGEPESRVEIRTAHGRLVAATDYFSDMDRDTDGSTVRKAAWTADGRFFVYITGSSGGHSPWHHPIFFYSRQRHRFYSLDHFLGTLGSGDGAVTGSFQLRNPCTVITRGRFYKNYPGIKTRNVSDSSGEKILTINLQRIERHLSRSVEDHFFQP